MFGDKQTKFDSKHTLISILAKQFGFKVYNKDLIWSHDNEFKDVWKRFPGRKSADVHERRFNLYYLSKSISNLNGETAECGVFHGASSFLILKSNIDFKKEHYIFDSFEGLSCPDKIDIVEDEKINKWSKNDLAIDERIVRENLDQFDNVTYLKGWIPEKFNFVASKRFSLVHIDVDLYQPTLDSISFFYPRMVTGGMLICDDYGFVTCPGAYKALNKFLEDKVENIIHLTTGQAVIIKQP